MMLRERTYSSLVVYELRPDKFSRYIFGSLLGLIGGIIAPLVGALLTALSWVVGPAWHSFGLHRIGTVLLLSGIPLLIFGAHCMDLNDRRDRNNRSSRL